MQLDCRGLVCPEPVIRTKQQLEQIKDGDKLEILVNEKAPFENISRFLNSQQQEFVVENLNGNEKKIVLNKKAKITDINISDYDCNLSLKNKKVIYLNEDRAGSGVVGEVLLSKLLGAFLQVDNKPYAVLCVNNAVKMTTNRASASFEVLKKFQSIGVEVLSCGSCLEAYGLVDKLGVGKISNAYEIVDLLSNYEMIKL
ncbi:selenium metabolism protein [Campylobacter pinnipediorum subsp. caledonicus]|uniref:sulfurtransferase-like selenium metabolism protein YedF n=1 Tax=Campylobacter pinnipediorum TaxID=1965231 RepID=UPI0009953725|nr:sulfurtransferase-like selenium metabolism protein YedF [Campylobacter pinnipediorum]OPA72496.1 selenium metabolism protein [Campylobacter pinnipediorum subsp. caledonicus]